MRRLGLVLILIIAATITVQVVPQCEEDEYVQGVGDYAAGYWSEYVCQHDSR